MFTNYLSFFTNFLIFLWIITFLLFYILLYNTKKNETIYNKKIFYRLFGIIGIVAVLTQWCYIYAPKRIFANSDHHIIEHLGFTFQDRIKLADSQDSLNAIWDDKGGYLQIDKNSNGFTVGGHDFYEPLYVQSPTNKELYLLSNSIFEPSIKQNIVFQWDSISINFNINYKEDSFSSFTATYLGQNYGPFEIPIAMPLKNGFSVGGLINKTPNETPQIGKISALLEDCYFIRKGYDKDKDKNGDYSLAFFPSNQFIDSQPLVSIDGNIINNSQHNFNVQINPQQEFYFGLWSTQNKIYTLNTKDGGVSEWLYTFSDKKYLKKIENKNESLFFTSSSDEVGGSEQKAGFYYPLFENKVNNNHFSANLSYLSAGTNEKMLFRLVNFDKDDISDESIKNYAAGESILVDTKNPAHIQWIFKITDLKDTNSLKFYHIIGFTVLLLLLIYISIYLTDDYKQTKAEYFAYFLVFALLTIRSILLWRASTFIPTEEISPSVYNNLRGLGIKYFMVSSIATIVFFILIYIWKIWGYQAKSKFTIQTAYFTPKVFYWFLLYVFAFGIRLAGHVVSQLERFGAVFLPLVVYFFLEYYFLTLHQNPQSDSKKEYTLLSRINWILCFGYLAISDAGFSMVFLVSSLIYLMVRQYTFPINKSFKKPMLKRFMMSLPALLGLLVFLFVSPYIFSSIFRHTSLYITGFSILCVVFAVWAFFRKSEFVYFGKTIPKFTLIGVLGVIALSIFLFKGKISEKVKDKSYAQYRAEVLINTPDEIIQKEEFKFNLGNDSKLLRAAQNQWIINYFKEQSHFSLIDYFRIVPSFQKGSPYLTQISDLVSVRYVIGEHNSFVITLILGIMILLILAATDNDTNFNQFSIIRVRILCLLFGIGYFIWLAATNRMIFLGQDFPLLSLNSILTILTTFTILFISIILGDLSNQDDDKSSYKHLAFENEGKKLAYNTLQIIMLISILVIPYVLQRDFSEEKFNLDNTITKLQSEFANLNSSFAEYQDSEEVKNNRSLKLPELLQNFDKSAYSPKNNKTIFKDSLISTFAKSAYDAYISVLSKKNSPDYLIHVKKGADDIYEFAINKLYYNVSSPESNANAWRGNLLAESKNNVFSFVNRRTNNEQVLDIDKVENRLDDKILSSNENLQNNNLRITSLPAGWCLDSLPAIILSRTSGGEKLNRSTFVVKNGQDIYRSSKSEFAVLLKPNDVIQFEPVTKAKPVTLKLKHQSQEYLAKNVWLNGKNQFFYPLSQKFLWTYHFANLVKAKFDKFEEDAPEKNKNITLTIDPQLTENVYDIAHTFFKKDRWGRDIKSENARAFNLVVLGNDGGIRALCDYKKGAKTKIDPNRIGSYSELFNTIYLNSQIDQERLLFGNRCLMRMDNGPASTFKPILYGSVTSQFNFGWEKLRLGEVTNDLYQGNFIKYFGGKKKNFPFSSRTNLSNHGINEYISQSTNTYNSMIVFLGSLNKAQIKREMDYLNGNITNGSFLANGRVEPRFNFPIFNYSQRDYHIANLPNDSFWQNPESLMGTGLSRNVNLPVNYEQLRGTNGANIQNLAFDLDSTEFATSKSSYRAWSFPEPSQLYMVDRFDLHNAIMQCATGAYPINTTPAKMAEMAASLFSFNRSFKSSVLSNRQNKYREFDFDDSWGSASNLTNFYSANLFNGMRNTIVGDKGTGRDLLTKIINEFPEYHFYAKTGTISGGEKSDRRDKNLLLIISRDQLESRTLSPEDMKNNKFFVLYFSFYKNSSGSEWNETAEPLREMIRTVIKSNSFKSYMNHE